MRGRDEYLERTEAYGRNVLSLHVIVDIPETFLNVRRVLNGIKKCLKIDRAEMFVCKRM